MKTLLSLIFLFPLTGFSNTYPTDPITKDTLVGTWEAVREQFIVAVLYHMEIRKAGDSCLVSFLQAPGEPPSNIATLRLIRSDVVDGKVKLLFRSTEGPKVDVTFEGSGSTLYGVQGTLHGKFTCRVDVGAPPCQEKDEVDFKKGSWTRDFSVLSTEAEKYIEELRSKPKT